MFNRITWPKNMAQFLSDTGCEVILIDNNSTYPPLLEWYKTCPYKVHRLTSNCGHRAFWNAGISDLYPDQYYVVTDHDLYLSDIPSDYINILMNEFELHDNITKCGFSLSIEDLPNNPFANRAKEFESQYWRNKIGDNGFYNSPLDTTFSLYDRKKSGGHFWSAIRSPYPYTSKHLPWYLTKELILNDEEQLYYLKTTNDSSYWSKFIKSDFYI